MTLKQRVAAEHLLLQLRKSQKIQLKASKREQRLHEKAIAKVMAGNPTKAEKLEKRSERWAAKRMEAQKSEREYLDRMMQQNRDRDWSEVLCSVPSEKCGPPSGADVVEAPSGPSSLGNPPAYSHQDTQL
ncbi:uncharacterized protein LOC106181282 [Lingula anatina]|uniref:Uncharacterized protein LOC106181282 n=1 Tax=Lingula anatina TaxID=7574 RepID=A0A1S3H4Q2_LINAN|nr:uncharacterized protein LOC106181282 [Lingula anatina]|eukprot:XP_013421064.1 uncharacterized protein LOC106181282 [Lingula anatina]